MFKLMNDLPDDIVGVTAEGKITGEDYEKILIPTVEEKLKYLDGIKLIYNLSDSYTGYEFEAVIDDTKFGLKHLASFKKIAFVSDHEFMNSALRLFGYMIPCEVKIFSNSELSDAKDWVKSS